MYETPTYKRMTYNEKENQKGVGVCLYTSGGVQNKLKGISCRVNIS